MAVNITVSTAGLEGPPGPPGQVSGANITGVGNVTVTYSGQLAIISGSSQGGIVNTSGLATSGDLLVIDNNLQNTGSILYNDIIGLSGIFSISSNPNIVYTTGNQIISGEKSFLGSRIYFWGKSMGVTPLLYIDTGTNTVQISDANMIAFDSFSRKLYDNFGNQTVDWQGKMLYDFFTSGSLDWNNRILYGDLGNQSLDWQNKILYGSWIIPDLTQTGIIIEVQINSLSGYSNNTFATTSNVSITGQTLYNDINGLSGIFNTTGITLQNSINTLTTNLITTGQTLYQDLIGLSGIFITSGNSWQSEINTLTTNITSTGNNLYVDITGLSGQFNSSFSTQTNLTTTGQNLLNIIFGGDSNISGNLYNTGSYLYNLITGVSGSISGSVGGVTLSQLNSLSGYSNNTFATINNLFITGASGIQYTNNLSGVLALQIAGATAGVSSLNGQSGSITIYTTGDNHLFITSSINHIFISGSGIVNSGDLSTINSNLATTGQTLYNDIVGFSGIFNISGITLQSEINTLTNNLTSTGLGIGTLITNLGTTGSTLYVDLTGLSGQFNTNFATQSSLTTTGINLINYSIGIGNNISGNLTATGQTLYNDITGLSGQFNINFATITNLGTTGSTLYVDLTGLSGQFNNNFATQTNVTNTGITLWNLTIGGDTNLSGNLTQSGITLRNLIIGGDTNLSGNLSTTGSNLYIIITGLSGQSNLNYATITNLGTTGSTLYNYIISEGTNISGNLTQTGIILYSDLTGLSGQFNTNFATTSNLATTGSNLYIDITGLSGQHNTNFYSMGTTLSGNLTTTGVNLINYAIGIGNNISGNLTATGQTLYNDIVGLSGVFNISGTNWQNEINTLTTNLTNTGLSIGTLITNLYTTGSTLYKDIVGLSGQITGSLYLTGINPGTNISVTNLNNGTFTVNYAGGAGSNVEVTGSSALATANFTGFNGINVFSSGNYVCITGGGGGGGTTNLSITGSSYLVIGNLSGINGITVSQVGSSGINIDGSTLNTNCINNSNNLSGNLTTTGQTLYNDIIIASGFFANRPELYFPFSTVSTAWAVPGAVTLWNGNNSPIVYMEMASFTGVQLQINKLATSSQVTGALWLGYSTTYSQTASNYTSLNSSNVKSYINVANTFINSGWQPITTLAKSGVYVALLASGGNAVSVTFGQIMMGLM